MLPLAFGEAGVPTPVLRDALASASHINAYGPVAGSSELRTAAAGYWARRGLPTEPADVVCGPGSKALLYGLLLNLGADVAIPGPSWVQLPPRRPRSPASGPNPKPAPSTAAIFIPARITESATTSISPISSEYTP